VGQLRHILEKATCALVPLFRPFCLQIQWRAENPSQFGGTAVTASFGNIRRILQRMSFQVKKSTATAQKATTLALGELHM